VGNDNRLLKVKLAKNRYGISHEADKDWRCGEEQHWRYGAYSPSQLNDEAVKLYSDTIRRGIISVSLTSNRRISRDYIEDLVQDGLLRLVKRMRKGMPMPHVLARYCQRIGVRLALRYILQRSKEEKAINGKSEITKVREIGEIGNRMRAHSERHSSIFGKVTWETKDEMSLPWVAPDPHFIAETNETLQLSDREAAGHFSAKLASYAGRSESKPLDKMTFRRAVSEL